MSSFFKNIAVTYWTGQIYNDTNSDMLCEIEEEFSSALIDAASNYVCAVERMELSGNNIFFYNAQLDDDAEYDEVTEKYYSVLTLATQNWTDTDAYFKIYIFGGYFSLGALIDGINEWAKIDVDGEFDPLDWGYFTMTPDGKIQFIISLDPSDIEFGKNLVFMFSSAQLASIFGLPKMDEEQKKDEPNRMKAKDWWHFYSDYTYYDTKGFQTRASRVDCGIIPTMVQLRSTLPFESDQVSSTKTNIVTDFNIVAGSATEFGLAETDDIKTPLANDMTVRRIFSSGITQACGGMLIYTPAERRWLNFSAPIAIYNLRLWVELVYNDPDQVIKYYIPPGGKFSIKLGLYLRSG